MAGRIGGQGRKQSGTGLPVVMSPDQTAGILHCAGGGLTGEENSWQPVGNPTSVVSCATLRKEQGHWRYHCCFIPRASFIFSLLVVKPTV